MNGVFGNTFDFNRNGNIDPFERAAEYSLINHILDENDKLTSLSEENRHFHNSSLEEEPNTSDDINSCSCDPKFEEDWFNDSGEDDWLDESKNDDDWSDCLDEDDWSIDSDEISCNVENYDFGAATDYVFNKIDDDATDDSAVECSSSPEDAFGSVDSDSLGQSLSSNASSASKIANECDENPSVLNDSSFNDSISSNLSQSYTTDSNLNNQSSCDSSDSSIVFDNYEKYPLGSKLGFFREPTERGNIVHPDVKVNLLSSLIFGAKKVPYEAYQKIQKAGTLCFQDRIKLWEERRDYLLEHDLDFGELSKLWRNDALNKIKQSGLNPYDYWDMFSR